MAKLHWREREMLRRFYPPDAEGELERRLRETIQRWFQPGDAVLDAGCGSGRLFSYDLRGRAARIVGVDVQRELAGNPNIEEPVLGDLAAIPFRDQTFDLIICKHVLEHLERPPTAWREVPASRWRSSICSRRRRSTCPSILWPLLWAPPTRSW